jgi:CubicO group peptidase (beta-lactamase class C family)
LSRVERDRGPVGGWPICSPDEVGVSSSLLSDLTRYIERELPHIRCLLVVHGGCLVYERYFQGLGREDLHELMSGAKSLTATLVGIALQEGFLRDVDQKLVAFCSDCAAWDTDPRLERITLRHLLTMTSGLHWGNSPAEVDRWLQSDGWLRRAFELPVVDEPGTAFAYKPDPRLVAWIVSQATGMAASAFARTYLFEPLGISRWQWPIDAGQDGISLRPRDMATLGYLYLNGGRWGDRQVVQGAFVDQATRRQVQGGFPENEGYGYYWWVKTIQGHRAFYASGFGGQYILVVPELDVVVAITSNPDRPHLENRTIVGERVMAAIDGGSQDG